jgi:type I restriction enzyme S subunit
MKQGWQIKDFELCLDKTKTTTKLQSSLYGEQGAFPIVSQEKELISGYWDKEEDVFKHKTPIVVFGDHTKVVKYIDFDFVIGADGVKILSPKPFLNPKYFYYWVCSIQIPSHGYARHYRYLKEHQVPVPSLSEQQRIVALLDAEFAKIDALKANAEKNLQNAKDLFQAALKKELEPKDGWKWSYLPAISENLDSKRIPITQKDRIAGIYPYYGASGIVDYVSEYLFDDDLLLISEDGANLLARSTPIAFSVSGKIWVNNHAHILKFKDMATQKIVEYYFASILIDEYITGAAQPKLTQANLNKIGIPIPPTINDQQTIVARLDVLNDKCKTLQANYEKTLSLCDDLKQALLRKAFNGEI